MEEVLETLNNIQLKRGRITFGWDDWLKPRGEEPVEAEVIDLGSEVPDPDGVILLAGQQPVGVMVEFKSGRGHVWEWYSLLSELVIDG